jgi:hypothetical protein
MELQIGLAGWDSSWVLKLFLSMPMTITKENEIRFRSFSSLMSSWATKTKNKGSMDV